MEKIEEKETAKMSPKEVKSRILNLEDRARQKYSVEKPDWFQVKETLEEDEFKDYSQLIEDWNNIVMIEKLNAFYLRHKDMFIKVRRMGWNYYEFPAEGFGDLNEYGEWDFIGGNAPRYQRSLPLRCFR